MKNKYLSSSSISIKLMGFGIILSVCLVLLFSVNKNLTLAADLLTVSPHIVGTDNLIGAHNAEWRFVATTTTQIDPGDAIEFIFPNQLQNAQPFSTSSDPTLVATSSSVSSFNLYAGPMNESTISAGGPIPAAMTPNGLAIYGFSTTTIPGGSVISMTVSGLSNAVSQLSGVQNIPIVVQAGTLNNPGFAGSGWSGGPKFAATSTVSLTRAGGALVSDVNSQVTDSSQDPGAATTVTVSITLATDLPSGSKIGVNLPTEFSLQNATTTAADAAGISIAAGPVIASGDFTTITSVGTNRIIFTTSGGTVPAGDAITVSVGGLTNPSNAGVYRPFSIFTMKSNYGLLDGSYFGFEQSDYSNGAPSPADAVYVGGKDTLAIQVFKQSGAGTTSLSASDISQIKVAAGCPDKQFFMGEKWLDQSGVAVYDRILDCNYMLGVDPFDSTSTSFYSSFLPPAMKTVNLVSSGGTGAAATTTLVFGVPDATTTVTLHLPNAVSGAQAFIQAYSADNQSFSPVFTDTTYATAGFNGSTGDGYAIIPIHSGEPWNFNVFGGAKGSADNFKDASGNEYWPPVISSMTLSAGTTTNVDLGTYSYVKADQNLDVTLTTTSNGVINNACVGVMRSGGGVFSSPQDMTCQPNFGNDYLFRVPPGAITIVVNRPGFGNQQEFALAIPDGATATTTKSIVLSSPTSYINASVTITANGTTTPVKGAPVFAQGSNGFANAMTGTDGTAKLYVQPGTYTVQGFAPAFGSLPAQTGISVTNGSNPTASFTVNAGNLHIISGRVTQSGSPVVGLNIGANGTGSTNGGNGVQTDASGNYSLYVPAGTYQVQGWSQSTGGLSPQNADVTSGNVSNLNWALMGQGTLHIEVLNASNISRLFAGAFDSSTGQGNGTNSWTASSTSEVANINLPAGTYNVQAGSPSLGQFGSSTETITAGVTTDVTFDAAGGGVLDTLSGKVTAASGGAAISGVNVWASVVGAPGFFSTQTDASGNYSLTVSDGKTYHVGARLLGYISSQGDVNVTVGSPSVTQDFTLSSAGAAITGTVKDSNGNAISDAFVQAFKTGAASSTQTGAVTDALGAYSISVDAGSTWNLVANGSCYNPSSPTSASAGASGKNFTLSTKSGCSAPTPQVQAVTDTSGGQVANNGLTLNIPANALGNSQSTVSVSVSDASNPVASANATPLDGSVKDITATNSSGESVTSLNNDASIVLSYDPTQLPVGFDASNLQLGYFDTGTNQWEPVAATVDTTNHTLTASVSHFTEYGPILPGVPAAPTGLAASSASASSLSLSWTASPTATYYYIYRSSTDSNFTTSLATTTGSSYTDSGLTAGTTYYYEVAGDNANGEGQNSSSAHAVPTAAASPSPTPTGGSSGSGGGTVPPAVLTAMLAASASTTAYLDSLASSTVSGCPAGYTCVPIPGNANMSVNAKNAVAGTSAVYAFTRSLHDGMSGDDVSALQSFLASKDYLIIPPGIAKGYFGALTRAALSAFQKDNGIEAIGIFGPETTAAVEKLMNEAGNSTLPSSASVSASTSTSLDLTRPLYIGESGDDVSALQDFLIEKGYLVMPSGIAKGYFGQLTEAAVKVFQKEVGIEAIGTVGSQTSAAIKKIKDQ